MTKKKYKRYSPEFKRHALKKASEDGITDRGVCEDLGISERQLRRWRDPYRLLRSVTKTNFKRSIKPGSNQYTQKRPLEW